MRYPTTEKFPIDFSQLNVFEEKIDAEVDFNDSSVWSDIDPKRWYGVDFLCSCLIIIKVDSHTALWFFLV